MANKFASCLNLPHSLPKGIIADLKDDDNRSLKKYINNTLTPEDRYILKIERSLPEQKDHLEAKLEEAKNVHTSEAVKSSIAGSYVNRPDDPANELNNFKTTGLSKLLKNMVQRYSSIKKVLKSAFATDKLTEHDIALLNEFEKVGGFAQQFNKVFDSIHRTTDNLYFRYKDYLQYFPKLNASEGSKFDDSFKSAVSSVAFEWLHTEAKLALGQTDETLRKMFGLGKDDPIPKAMGEMLTDLGVNRDFLADQLGRVMLDRMNIEAITAGDKVANATATAKMVRSFGYMAIATMENMTYSNGQPIIKRQEVYNAAVEALKEGDSLDYDDVFYDPSDEQRAVDSDRKSTGKKGKPTRKYIKLNTNRLNAKGLGRHDIHSDLDAAKELLHSAPDAFDKVFGTTPVIKTISWVKIKVSQKIGKFGKANELQTKNLQKNVDVKYVKSTATFNVFKALTGAALDVAVDMQTMDGKLNLRNKSIEGINRGKQNDVDAVADHLREEEAQNLLYNTPGQNRPFYINARFQAQHRMLQTGFNPQGSKIVRNLFTPEAFNIEFNPKTDKATDEAFLQSIALAFDIETIKKGGKEAQLEALDESLKNEKIAAAIKVLQEFHKTGKMSEEQQMTVALGTKETGTNLHGLKGLVEYARYISYKADKNPNKGLFSTDMYDENDGVSNGVIFATLMFIPDSAVNTKEKAQDLLAIAAMGGVSVDRRATTPNLDKLIAQKNLNDAYQRMGAEWAITEQRMKLDLLEANKLAVSKYDKLDAKIKKKQQAKQSVSKEEIKARQLYFADAEATYIKLNKFLAIESLLGRFTESKDAEGKMVNDGVVNKLIRSLSKPRTMQTVYRAGITTQNRILATENVIDDGIYTSLENIIQRAESATKDEIGLLEREGLIHQELRKLFETVATLTGGKVGTGNLDINKYVTGGLINPTELKTFKLSTPQIKAIVQSTRDTYGEAMKQAIESVFSHVIAASKPFTTLMERAASTYNLVLKAKVDAAIAAKNKDITDTYDTTAADLAKAKQELKDAAAVDINKWKKNLADYPVDSSWYKNTSNMIQNREKRLKLELAKLEKNAAQAPRQSLKKQLGQLTIEEMKKITDDIAFLIPKIKTPVHTDADPSYLYLAKPGSVRDNVALMGEDAYDDNAEVEQEYRNGIPRSKGYVITIPFLKSIGAAGFVKAVQMMDAMHANHVMGIEGVDLLSIHDGFVHGIKDSKAIADSINQYFNDTLFGAKDKPAYSIGAELMAMHKEMTSTREDGLEVHSITDILAENNVSMDDEINRYLKDGVINADTYELDTDELNELRKEIQKTSTNNLTYKQAREQALKISVGLSDNMTIDEQAAWLEDLHSRIASQAESMAEQVTRNKQTLGEAVTHIAQYPHNGVGVDNDSVSKDAKIFGVTRNKVLSIAGDKATAISDESVNIFRRTGISGSSAIDVSTDPADYANQRPDTRSVDAKNNLEIFDSILTMDEQAAGASIVVSDAHKADLRRILHDIVNKVMKPIQFYMDAHGPANDETAGAYTPHNSSVWLQTQQVGQPTPGMLGQGIRMSAAEVYVHELIHHITNFGLRNDTYTARQAYDLYEFARESLKAKYGANAPYRAFMENPNNGYPAPTTAAEKQAAEDRWDVVINDANMSYERIAAKARWDHMFEAKQNPDGTHDGVDEFLTIGMTNENFKREMSQLAISQALLKKRKGLTTIFEKNIQTTIVNIYTMLMDFMQHMFKQQKHSPMVGAEIENFVRTLAKVDTKNRNLIFAAASEGEAKLTALGLVGDEKVKDLANVAMNKFQIGRAITKLKKLPQANNIISHQMRVAMLWYKDQEQGLIPTMYHEMKGTTDHNRSLHDLLSKRNMVIDVAKQEADKIMAAVNRDWFDRKLVSHQKTALTKVMLKGDISLLQDYASLDAIKGFIDSPTKRDAHIATLLGQVSTLVNSVIKNPTQRQEYMNFFEGGIHDLAERMITGASSKESVYYKNAHNLAIMDNTKYAGKLAKTPIFNDLVKVLDQLASVASIKYTSAKDRYAVSDLITTNPEAVSNVLLNHRLLQEQARRDLFYDNPAEMEKGYVKTLLNPRIQFEQGTLADEQAFADRGFVRQERPFRRDNGPDGVDPVRDDIYMYVSHNGTINDYLSGLFSTTRNKRKGANSYDIELQLGNTANASVVADANNKAALLAIKAKANRMFQSTVRTKAPADTNYMTPAFNAQGKMTTLTYIMSEHTKDTVLQQFSEFDTVLGSMAGQIVDKLKTPEINAEVVIALRDMWDKEKGQYPEAYVKIGPKSTVKRYRDVYENLPPATKQHILSEWGDNSMMISRDVIDLVFGQRKYSIVELFEKSPTERNMLERLTVEALTFALKFNNPFAKEQLESPKGRAVTRAKTIEDFFTQLTALAKGNIIIRSLTVTFGNHLSNVMYLKNKGIPMKDILVLQREAMVSALQYQADNDKLRAYKLKRDTIDRNPNMNAIDKAKAMDVLDRHILRLQHILATNPSTKLIEAGLLPSIVDDVNTEIAQSPFKFGVDKMIDTGLNKLPNKVAKIGRVMFMTEDTEGYKMTNNAVKMTDYVGRYVLYKHYTSKGVTHKDAVSKVQDEFINFAPPTHRMLEYANTIGLVWFSKYQLRVLKHIKNNIAERPFTTLATFIISSATHGQNILTSIPFVTKDALQIFGNPFSAFTSSIDTILPIHAVDTVTGSIL